jgi:hypothetical protein
MYHLFLAYFASINADKTVRDKSENRYNIRNRPAALGWCFSGILKRAWHMVR